MCDVTITSRDGITINLNEASQERLLRRSEEMSEDYLADMYNTPVHIIRRAVLDAWMNNLMRPVAQTSTTALATMSLA